MEAFAVDDDCDDPDVCGSHLLQLRASKAAAKAAVDDAHPVAELNEDSVVVEDAGKCADLNDERNSVCKPVIEWVLSGGKGDPHASEWFADMQTITGVDYMSASKDDFQRLYFCSPPGGKACGTAPCGCSKPPCNSCFGGAPARQLRGGCSSHPHSIECKAPRNTFEYNGQKWPTYTFEGSQEMHIFAIGDWGGMDGSLNPIEGRAPLIAYAGGQKSGPSTFPRSRIYLNNPVMNCKHDPLVKCFEGKYCPFGCGYVKEIDDHAQLLVAQAMKERANIKDPQLILNVGDNFYWGGIEKTCGTPMDSISFTAHHQFDQIFEGVYNGKGLDGKPWLSVLGNHDWGGRVFNNGWDQQIAYTWASPRWVMPAAFWRTTAEYPTQGFSVDMWFFDTNFQDAHANDEDPDHNICGPNNPAGATCASAGGPVDKDSCPSWFRGLWEQEKAWLTRTMEESTASWQIAVTHFPCAQDGQGGSFYRQLRQEYGLDLLVTGHRHDQELWAYNDRRNNMGGLTCFVTGGGGGITSESSPNPMRKYEWYGEAQYGFFDITVTKERLTVESINFDGKVLRTAEVRPHQGSKSKEQTE